MTSDWNPLDWDSWESDYSTRAALHPFTKWVPVDTTLATPATAEDLITIDPGTPTVNLVTNPSMETGTPPTGYTAVGATLAQSATVARNGTNSLRITPDNAAAAEGAYWTLPSLASQPDVGAVLVVSAYFQDNAGSGDDAHILITDSSGTTLATGNTITLSAAWQRSTAFFPLTTAAASYRVYMVTVSQHGTVFYVDSLQAEMQRSSVASDYCDGSLGRNYEWEGTAHASKSRRRRDLSVARGFSLHFTRDTYIAFDVTASSTTGVFVAAGSDWSTTVIDTHRNISIINAVAGEQPRVYGAVFGLHFSGRQGGGTN